MKTVGVIVGLRRAGDQLAGDEGLGANAQRREGRWCFLLRPHRMHERKARNRRQQALGSRETNLLRVADRESHGQRHGKSGPSPPAFPGYRKVSQLHGQAFSMSYAKGFCVNVAQSTAAVWISERRR